MFASTALCASSGKIFTRYQSTITLFEALEISLYALIIISDLRTSALHVRNGLIATRMRFFSSTACAIWQFQHVCLYSRKLAHTEQAIIENAEQVYKAARASYKSADSWRWALQLFHRTSKHEEAVKEKHTTSTPMPGLFCFTALLIKSCVHSQPFERTLKRKAIKTSFRTPLTHAELCHIAWCGSSWALLL